MEFSFLFPLPDKIELNIANGGGIKEGEVLGHYPLEKKIGLNLAHELSLSPKKVGQALMVSLGNNIKRGDLVAEKKIFWRPSVKIYSPIDGKIFSFDQEKGILTIIAAAKRVTVRAPLSGKIEKIEKGGLVIKTKGTIFPLSWAKGKIVFGPVKKYSGSLADLSVNDRGEILLLKEKINMSLVKKSEALRIKGLISAKKSDDFPTLLTLAQLKNPEDEEKIAAQESQKAVLDPKNKVLGIVSF
ncbi:hypothetical protein KBI33_03125 [Candidatus Shapirobacteria bacterium]|nr:hypothetical protein [Candidatus Shapirobacteria bacterium]